MCGRLNILDNPVMTAVMALLGIEFVTITNTDLRPGDPVAAVACIDKTVQQVNLLWGIKPGWSSTLIFNARAETAAQLKTFKQAFLSQRCVVPCSAWYEWPVINGKKVKRKFTSADHCAFMAGIWLTEKEVHKLVTLTVAANTNSVKDRMPLLIKSDAIDVWLKGSVEDVQPLIVA